MCRGETNLARSLDESPIEQRITKLESRLACSSRLIAILRPPCPSSYVFTFSQTRFSMKFGGDSSPTELLNRKRDERRFEKFLACLTLSLSLSLLLHSGRDFSVRYKTCRGIISNFYFKYLARLSFVVFGKESS